MSDQTFYTASRISAQRSLTPDGFLVCHDCLIARTGAMAYGPGETPVRVNDRGFALIHRDADEVFSQDSINSINGKPVTDDHPTVDVTPANYRELSRGHVTRPRRGEGEQSEWLVADIMITDPGLMRKVQDGKVELSCGYLAHYVEDAPGRGRQTNIRHNHLAVVDKGRCGPSCRIGDKAYQAGEKLTLDAENEYVVGVVANHSKAEADGMSKATKDRIEKLLQGSALQRVTKHMTADGLKSFKDAVGKALDADDEDEDEPSKKMEMGGHTIEIHNHGTPTGDADEDDDEDKRKKTEDRITANVTAGVLDALKKAGVKFSDVGEGINPGGGAAGDPASENEKLKGDIDLEAPPGTNTGDRARVLEAIVRDSAALAQAMAPGITLPTMDRTAGTDDGAARRVLDSVCAMRRAALTVALSQPSTIMMATSLVRDAANISKMSCGDIRTSFKAVGEHARAMQQAATRTGDAARQAGGPQFARSQSNAGRAVGGVTSVAQLGKLYSDHYKGQQGAGR